MNLTKTNSLRWALLYALGLTLGIATAEPIFDWINGELAVDSAVDAAIKGGVTFVIAFPALFGYASWRNRRER